MMGGSTSRCAVIDTWSHFTNKHNKTISLSRYIEIVIITRIQTCMMPVQHDTSLNCPDDVLIVRNICIEMF